MLKITGYPDRYSAEPGERIEFKVSLEEGNSFEARLVRVDPRRRQSAWAGSQVPSYPKRSGRPPFWVYAVDRRRELHERP